jgi:hypothetical protein
MPINLDQTGPAHLLSTDEDGLILNGSPVISKSIHVSDTQPRDFFGNIATKLLWLDTGTQGVSAFPNGGAANWILRTNGNGTVSWVPPSVLDASKFHYRVSTSTFVSNPGSGYIRFPRAFLAGMSTTTNLVISGYSIAGDPNYIVNGVYPPGVPNYNLISSFINGLSAYGNNTRRGFIKIEKENDPNHFQIYEMKSITDRTGWFEIEVAILRVEVGDENFPEDEPVSVTFSVSGPEALTQDLSSYLTFTGTQTAILKTFTKPVISEPKLNDSSFSLTGLDIESNGVLTCDPFTLSGVSIAASGKILCSTSTFNIGDRIYVSGVNTGTGSINGYNSAGTTYYIIATNGTTEFTISSFPNGSAATTTIGTVNGATFTKVVFNVHDAVRITGSNAGTGVITDYDPLGSIYFIIATNGIDQFTLSSTMGGTAITTTAGNVTGAMAAESNVGSNIIFEDAESSNGYETRLSVVTSSADQKILLPDHTTTLVGIDTTQTLSNKTIIEPLVKDPTINLTSNSDSITITSQVSTSYNTRFNTSANNVFNWTSNLGYNGTAWSKDDPTKSAWRLSTTVDDASNTTSQLLVAYEAYDSASLVDKLKLDGDGILTIPSNVASTTTTSGTLVVGGGVGIAGTTNIGGNLNVTGVIDGGSIQATPIGSTSANTGAFTTLTANGVTTITNATVSTSKTTGALVVSGGVGIGGASYINGPVYLNNLDPSESELAGYSLVIQNPAAKLRVGPNYTAGDADYIDIETLEDNPTISTTSDNFSIINDRSAGNITLTATSGSVLVSANTASTNKTTGALKVAGGLGVELQVHANDVYVYGQTGLSNTASQVVSVAATQTLTNKTLTAPTVNNGILTGTVTASGSVGLQGQLLSSTVTGVAWVNPVSASLQAYYKASDQNFNNNPGNVALPSTAYFTEGASFGYMNGTGNGTFTFTVTGTYQVIINFSINDLNDGAVYPAVDFWVRKNGLDTFKYCQVLTNGIQRGTVSEIVQFAATDTLTWYVNSNLRVNGGNGSPSATGSRLTILRLA